MSKPHVSVVIPALNEEKFLPLLLESLSKQTYSNFYTVVVDGHSKDSTVTVAESFQKRLKHLHVIRAPHAGLSYQRNLGGKDNESPWVVFSDADNIFLPYAIERMEEFIQTKSPKFFTTWTSPDSHIPSEALVAALGNVLIEASILVKRSFSPGPLTAVRRDIFEAVGGYNKNAKWGEDLEFSQRVVASGIPLEVLRESLYVWSMRRMRNEGTMTVLQKFARASIYTLITKKALTHMPGYAMGGHLYSQKKKKIKKTSLKQFELKLKNLVKELFE